MKHSTTLCAGMLTAMLLLGQPAWAADGHSATTVEQVSSTGLLSADSARLKDRTRHPSTGAKPKWINISPPQVATKGPNNFGYLALALDPVNTQTLYVGTSNQGLWKSVNGGHSWFKVNTGTNSDQLNGRIWSIAIDPFNPQTLYLADGYGAGQGVWKSTDGGVDWGQLLPADSPVLQKTSADVYQIVTDPYKDGHVLVAFHGMWGGGPAQTESGFLESHDGGNTWIIHPPERAWGAGNRYIFFLDNSSTWLLGTQEAGFWRTANGGKYWAQVSRVDRQDGGGSVYRAKNGDWYTGALHTLLRSTDDGRSWRAVGTQTRDGYYAIVGDGKGLYAQSANVGTNTTGPNYFVYSPETDGTTWEQYNSQVFSDGPMSLAYDPKNHIVYSSNFSAGIWRLDVK